MSTPLNHNNFCFGSPPDNIVSCYVSFLNDQSVVALSRSNKTWCNYSTLKMRREAILEDSICLKKLGYPQGLINAFRVNKLSLLKLPHRELGEVERVYCENLGTVTYALNDVPTTLFEIYHSSIIRSSDEFGRWGMHFSFQVAADAGVDSNATIALFAYQRFVGESYPLDLWIKHTGTIQDDFVDQDSQSVFKSAHVKTEHKEKAEGPCNTCDQFTSHVLEPYVGLIASCLANKQPVLTLGQIQQVDHPLPKLV